MSKFQNKYHVTYSDGTPVNPGAKYIVIRYDANAEKGEINRNAIRFWCKFLLDINPELANQIVQEINFEANKACILENENTFR